MAEKEGLNPGIAENSYGSVTADHAVTIENGSVCSGHHQRHLSRLSFHDVCYQVSSCFGRRKKKVILHSVSGILPTGLNAVMGPTGSGKTTLLDILAGRKDRSGLSGHVLINGERQPKNFKYTSGYVVQDDVIMGTLTVRENLHFSAALRLPSNTSYKQRKERVQRVIEELGLERSANTKIGNEFIRGVSGGERKRTNIGMELIIEPQVLFLDEPTTGLDANTAVSVIKLLKELSARGDRIIVLSIHQPRYSIFKLFDTLTLLSLGEVVYHGQARQALDYFNTLGFNCEEHENPADYFLDVVTSCEVLDTSTVVANTDTLSLDFESQKQTDLDLAVAYRESNLGKANQKKLTPLMDEVLQRESNGFRSTKQSGTYATSFLWQLLIVSLRSVVNLIRNPMTSVFQIITMIIFALLVGILYFQLDKKEFNPETLINDRIGALFFIVLNQVFGNLSAIDLFIRQRAIFIHENASGYYRVSAFFLAKVFTDLIPMRIIPLAFFSVVTYFMVGFQLDVAKFFIFFLTLCLLSISAASLGFAISARVAVTAIANVLIAMVFVLSMLFGGFLVALETLPDWIRWLKYVSIFRYAIEALTINEIVGQCYCPNTTSITECPFGDCTINGTEAISGRGYETSESWLWYDQIGLAGLSLVFLVITYINLRTVKKLK